MPLLTWGNSYQVSRFIKLLLSKCDKLMQLKKYVYFTIFEEQIIVLPATGLCVFIHLQAKSQYIYKFLLPNIKEKRIGVKIYVWLNVYNYQLDETKIL